MQELQPSERQVPFKTYLGKEQDTSAPQAGVERQMQQFGGKQMALLDMP